MDGSIKKWFDDNYGKKVVVIYGNCHATAIRYVLEQIEAVNRGYALFPFKAIQDVKDPSYFKNGVIQNCDLFIHQVIRDNNRYGIEWSSNEILKTVKKGSQVIGIPNVYHLPLCFFQQFSENKDFCGRKKNTVFFRDFILDKAYTENWSIKKTVLYYMHEDFKDYGKIKNEFDLFIERVLRRELDWDIKITDFILNNYQKQKLFFDPNHPTPAFINEIVNRLLELLNITIDTNSSIDDFRLDSFEMPICGCVKRALRLEYPDEELRKTGIKRKKGSMGLEDYIREYWTYEWQNTDMNLIRRGTSALNYVGATIVHKFL